MMGFTHRDSIMRTFREDTSQALSGQAPFEEVIVKLRLKKKEFYLNWEESREEERANF